MESSSRQDDASGRQQQSTTTRSYLRDKPTDRSLRHYQSFLLRAKPDGSEPESLRSATEFCYFL